MSVNIAFGKVLYTKFRGDHWVIDLTFKNPDDTPLNLTGFTFRFTMRDKVDGEKIFDHNTLGVVCDRVNLEGKIKYTVSNDLMKILKLAKYFWDIERTDTLGRVLTPISGELVVQGDISL